MYSRDRAIYFSTTGLYSNFSDVFTEKWQDIAVWPAIQLPGIMEDVSS